MKKSKGYLMRIIGCIVTFGASIVGTLLYFIIGKSNVLIVSVWGVIAVGLSLLDKGCKMEENEMLVEVLKNNMKYNQ